MYLSIDLTLSALPMYRNLFISWFVCSCLYESSEGDNSTSQSRYERGPKLGLLYTPTTVDIC